MLAVEDRAFQPSLVEEHLEDTLAFNLRGLPQVEAFKEKEVEGVEQQADGGGRIIVTAVARRVPPTSGLSAFVVVLCCLSG